jgi:hypothetical protein
MFLVGVCQKTKFLVRGQGAWKISPTPLFAYWFTEDANLVWTTIGVLHQNCYNQNIIFAREFLEKLTTNVNGNLKMYHF